MLQDQIRGGSGDWRLGHNRPPPRSIRLSREVLEESEIGSILHALLLFPAAKDFDHVPVVADALAARLIHLQLKAAPHLRALWSPAAPHLVALSQREVQRTLSTMHRRYRDRMIAARMGLGYLEEGLTGKAAKLPASMGGKHTVEGLSELVLRHSGESSAENVRKRAWSETRPVLHLAAAFQVLARVRSEAPWVGFDLDDPVLNDAIIRIAEIHERVILADPRFARWSDQLVRIRMVEGPLEF